MVSIWWLLIAFWLGTCCGVLLAGLLAASRRAEVDESADHAYDDTQPEALPEHPLHHLSR